MLLKELYKSKLLQYKLTGEKDSPDQLLAMLLLPEKDQYEPLMIEEGKFYKQYQQEFDEKISQVEKEFQFTEDEIRKIIKEKKLIATTIKKIKFGLFLQKASEHYIGD